MRFATTAALLSTLAALASAANQTVDVGLNGLTFSPSQVTANVGDVITFIFHPKNHSLTQSSFTTPCTAAFDAATGQSGFDSGFVPVASGSSPPMSLRVTTTTPLWFFCRQTGHCEQGMVFAINPTAQKTFAQFQATAQGAAAPAAGTSSSSAPGAAPSAAPPAAGTPNEAGPGTDSSTDTSTDSSTVVGTDSGVAAPTSTDNSGYGGYGGYGGPTDSSNGTDATGTGSAASASGTSTGHNAAGALSPRSVLAACVAVVLAALVL